MSKAEIQGTSNPSPSSDGQSAPSPEGLLKNGGNFRLLDQEGPFRIPETPLGPVGTKEWVASLSSGDRILHKTRINNLKRTFGVDSLLKLRSLTENPLAKQEAIILSNREFSRHYGFTGGDSEIKAKIDVYANTADKNREEKAILLQRKKDYELSNEVASTSNPIELTRLLFFSKDRRIRHEAAMKLDGILKAAATDQEKREKDDIRGILDTMRGRRAVEYTDASEGSRDSELGFLSTFSDFQDFLDEYVFRSDKTPEKSALLQSTHRRDDYSVSSVRRLPDKQARIARDKKQRKNKQVTPIMERSFEFDGKTIPVYTSIRKKADDEVVDKQYRKGSSIPGQLKDEIGMRVVVEQPEDIEAFHDLLLQGANEADLDITIEESENSLEDTQFNADNPGSSDLLRTLKFVIKIGSLTVELQYFDHEGYLESRYRDVVSHAEYEIRRAFKSGVVQHFFPLNIYEPGADSDYHETMMNGLIERKRREIRSGFYSS